VNFDFIVGENRVVQKLRYQECTHPTPVSPLVNGGKTVLRIL